MNNNKRPQSKLESIHKFKKKKLNNMLNNSIHQECITQLEALLVNQTQWEQNDVTNLFKIMYDNFEVSSIYGFQLEKALVNFIDQAQCHKNIQLAAMCMSRFSNIKQSNGGALIQMMINGFIKMGTQFFDFIETPSNLNDVKLSFIEKRNIFPDLIENNDENLHILLNRIDFIILTIEFIFDTNYRLSFNLPIEDTLRVALAVLSECPRALCLTSGHKLKRMVYYIHNVLIRLVKRIILVPSFRSCLFGYVRSLVEIVNNSLFITHNNEEVINTYVIGLIDLALQISLTDGIYCLSTMTTLVLPLIKFILISKNNIAICNSLNVLCQILKNNYDKGVNKCVTSCSKEIKDLIYFLVSNSWPNDIKLSSDKLLELIKMFTLVDVIDEIVENDMPNTVAEIEEEEDKINDETLEVQNIETQNSDVDVMENKSIDVEVMEVKEMDIEENQPEETMATEMIFDEEVRNESELITKEITAKSISLDEMLKSFVPF